MHKPPLSGDLKLIAATIGVWAAGRAPVVRLWMYGSRARHTDHPASDLDIAFEIDTFTTRAACDAFEPTRVAWAGELADLIGLDVQLEPIIEDTVQAAVTDHGVLIYERVNAPPSRWIGGDA